MQNSNEFHFVSLNTHSAYGNGDNSKGFCEHFDGKKSVLKRNIPKTLSKLKINRRDTQNE